MKPPGIRMFDTKATRSVEIAYETFHQIVSLVPGG
jgi:hypothetical protein